MSKTNTHPVIYFDGQCNLCNGFVTYVIKRDPQGLFHFATLQSASDEVLEQASPKGEASFETMLLRMNGKVYRYSDAVLKTFARLKSPVRILSVMLIVPKFLRDRIYRWIARRRYWIFGKTEQCMIPTPEIMTRFPDADVVSPADTPEH